MQFLLMCCIDEHRWGDLSPADRDGVMCDYGTWINCTVESGHHVASGKLQDSSLAKTLRMKSGRPVVTDGPFAETKEQLGGFHILECSDLAEALALAQGIPSLRVGGTVVVRAIEPN
jgi:hypothetical protein